MMAESSCGLLTARPSVVYYAMAITQKLELGRPYLIETVARIGGDTPSYSRMLMHIAESRGFVERSERNGRVYYTRVRRCAYPTLIRSSNGS